MFLEIKEQAQVTSKGQIVSYYLIKEGSSSQILQDRHQISCLLLLHLVSLLPTSFDLFANLRSLPFVLPTVTSDLVYLFLVTLLLFKHHSLYLVIKASILVLQF